MNIEKDTFEIIKILLSAFAGAFFAFVFIWLSDKRKGKNEKKKGNIRALSKIQFICNNNYTVLNTTLYSISEILRVFKEAREQSKDPFSANRLDKIILDQDLLLDLSNIDFINDYFLFNRIIEKHNNDVENLNHFHDSMKSARLNNVITSQNYIENLSRFENNLKLFNKFVINLMDQTESIVAKCRVLLKDETSFWKKLFRRTSKGYKKDFIKKYETELVLLRKEMKIVKDKSKAEIDKVLKSK